MKNSYCMLLFLFVGYIVHIYYVHPVYATSPVFNVPEKLKANILDCDFSSAPAVGDIDNDGKQDLVLGDEDGFVWFYKNIGDNEFPIFASGVKLMTSANKPVNPGRYATPYLVHWYSDDRFDLLVGCEDGRIWLYKNISTTQHEIVFDDTPVPLKSPAGEIDVGRYSVPFLSDYNSDGRNDLIVGNGEGYVWCYIKSGVSDELPVFGTGTIIKTVNKDDVVVDMNVGGRAAPVFFDWDEDGLRDMLVGDEYGYINCFLNTGTKTTPKFGTVSFRLKVNKLYDIDVGLEAKLCIIDWDMDGNPDLLVGSRDGQVMVYINSGAASIPTLNTGWRILERDEILDVGYFSAPYVIDWNGDYKKDLVVGDEFGNISVYLNSNSEGSPVFGAMFKVPSTATTDKLLDTGYNSIPRIIDWDEDGRKDILTGDKYGKVWVYLNTGKDFTPMFGTGTKIQKVVIKEVEIRGRIERQEVYEDLYVGENAAVDVCDWDNNGTKDLIVGDKNGYVKVYFNTGTNEKPVFGTPTYLYSAGRQMNVKGYAVPVVCHWNNDGKKDLLVGADDGTVYLYLNEGTDAAPLFFMPKNLSDINGHILDVGENAVPLLLDWNNDGKKDLVVGNRAGEIITYIGGITNSIPEVKISTPTGTQSRNVSINYILRDNDYDNIRIIPEFSVDGGITWLPATCAGISRDGLSGLFATPGGKEHVFVWDTIADLGKDKPSYRVKFRITPWDTEQGKVDITDDFIVDNITIPVESFIKVGGAKLNVGGYAKPYVVDWNNDGRKDLIVGNKLGEVYLLLNAGSDKEPMFINKTKLSIGASGDLDVGYYAAPVAVFDWNNDGKKDLIVGDEYGQINYFENIGTDDTPVFDTEQHIRQGTQNIVDVGAHSTPFVIDWNNDGKKDLVCGDDDGFINVFLNIGTDDMPIAGTPTKVMIGTKTYIDVGDRATVFVVDWNNNHKKDIICGARDGKVYLCLNYGTDEMPIFHSPVPITINGKPIDIGEYSAPVVCDWNNDGIQDILVGNKEGEVLVYLLSTTAINTPPKVDIETPKLKQFGSVTLRYVLTDPQGDTCNVSIEYSIDGGRVWHNATGVNNRDKLMASPDGEYYEFIWTSEEDLPGTSTEVLVRIIPEDSIAQGNVAQVSFMIDNLNVLPEVKNINITGTATTGNIEIVYDINDLDNDKMNIDVFYKKMPDGQWQPATVIGTTADIYSDTNLKLIWLSTVDEPNAKGEYRLKIIPYDYGGRGTECVSSEFRIDNTNVVSKIIKKGEMPVLEFSPTKLALQKPFDYDVLATVEVIPYEKIHVPPVETYPELLNTIRKITINKLPTGKPIHTLDAKLTIPYQDIGYLNTEKYLQMYELYEDKWVKIGGEVDVNANEVTCSIEHAGIYHIGLSVPIDEDLKTLFENGVMWVAPNPYKPNDGLEKTGTDITGIVFGNLKRNTKVRIYTISGEIVRESEPVAEDTACWRWDVKNRYGEDVGSGLYIYVITCGNDEPVIGKLAVIR